MSLRQAAAASRSTAPGLGAIGIFWGSFAAMVPAYKLRADVSDAQMGTALICTAVGGMAAMAMAPRLRRWLGARTLPVSAGLLALAAFLPVGIHSAASMAVVLVLMGAAMSSLDIAVNVRVSETESRTGLPLMNFNHAMFSFGFAVAALAVGLARRAGLGPEQIQPAVGLALLAMAALTWERSVPAAPGAGGPAARTPWPAVLPAAAILFAAFVTENATEAWSALHIERSLGGRPGEGALGPATMGLTMGLGRMAGQMLALRLGEARLVAGSALLAALGALLIAAAPVQWLAVTGVAVVGAGIAVLVPSANSLLGRRVAPEQLAIAIARAWMIGFTGFFIGPVAMGLMAETMGLRLAFAAIALVVLTILVSLRGLRRHP